jgi:hypothetical protein
MVMYEPEMLAALQERVGLSEDQAQQVLRTIEAVVAEEEAGQARGEIFQDAIASQSIGWLRLPQLLRRHAA